MLVGYHFVTAHEAAFVGCHAWCLCVSGLWWVDWGVVCEGAGGEERV